MPAPHPIGGAGIRTGSANPAARRDPGAASTSRYAATDRRGLASRYAATVTGEASASHYAATLTGEASASHYAPP